MWVRTASHLAPHPTYAELGTHGRYFLSRITNNTSPALRDRFALGFNSKVNW
jgi:hypothetical protein